MFTTIYKNTTITWCGSCGAENVEGWTQGPRKSGFCLKCSIGEVRADICRFEHEDPDEQLPYAKEHLRCLLALKAA